MWDAWPGPVPEELSKFAGIHAAEYIDTPHFWYPHVESPPPTMRPLVNAPHAGEMTRDPGQPAREGLHRRCGPCPTVSGVCAVGDVMGIWWSVHQ